MQQPDLAGGIIQRIAEPVDDARGISPSVADLRSLVSASDDRELAPAPAADSPGVPYVLVLPFKEAADDPDAEYFADGLTEGLIRLLGEVGSVDVIGSQTSFALKRRSFDVRDAGSVLGVDFVIDGTVEKAIDSVRVSVSLVDARSRKQVKARSFDCAAKDVLSIEGEIIASIAGSLGVELESTMLRRALRKRPENLSAYDCLLHAHQYQIQPSRENHERAREYLERAVSLDPGYSRAHAELARAYLGEKLFGWNAWPDPLGRAKRAAETAVRLDRSDPFGHHVLAMVYHQMKEYAKFEAEARLCLDSKPNDSRLLADLGILFTSVGQYVLGAKLLRQAQRLNPFHPDWYYLGFVFDNYDRRKYQGAIGELQRMDTPGFFWKYVFLAASHAQLGQSEPASDALKTLRELYPRFPENVDRELDRWGFQPIFRKHLKEGLVKAGLSRAE